MSQPNNNGVITIDNKNFNLPLSLLPKLKDNLHKQHHTPCQEVAGILEEFNYFKDSNPSQEKILLQLAALKVNFNIYKPGEFISNSSSENVHFILNGEVGLFEERTEREIKQEQYWCQQVEKIKRKIAQTNIVEEINKLEEEQLKIKKVLNFYQKEDQVNLIRQDNDRHQINFNIKNQCLYKLSQIIQSGVCVGPDTEHFERYNSLCQYQLISLSDSLILTLSQEDQCQVFYKKNNLQIKLSNIFNKCFNGILFEKEFIQKVIKNTTELNLIKNQLIYHENYDTSQNIYIICQGSVQITAKRLKQQIVLDNIEAGQIFGAEFLVSNKSLRQYTARSQNNNTLVFILSHDIMKLYFTNEMMNEIQKYAQKKFDEYSSTLNLNIQNIVELQRQKKLKIPLNFQNIENNNNNDNQNYKKVFQLKSLSPKNRSSILSLSKKHSEVIEESLKNLKIQTPRHCISRSGQFSVSTNTSSLASSGLENKMQALYSQISNKVSSITQLVAKSRQNSIDVENIGEYVPKATLQTTIPFIQMRDLSNDNTKNQLLKKNNTLSHIVSPKNEINLQKTNSNNAFQNKNIIQNELFKKYLNSQKTKQKKLSIQNQTDEFNKIDQIVRKSQTLTKEQLQNQLNLQIQQQTQEINFKLMDDLSPIKKKRNYSFKEPKNFEFTPISDNQNKIMSQFKLSEEVDRYINSNQIAQSFQQPPIFKQQQECQRLSKIKNINLHRRNKSLSNLPSAYKKICSFTPQQKNQQNKGNLQFNNFLVSSLTSL